MTISLVPLALFVALAAGSAAPAAEAPRDWDKPPPGTKEDQALWQKARDVNTELVVEQHVAARLANGAKASGYQERLPELARTGALPKTKAEALQARLTKAWTASVELGSTQWPVSRTRVCQYELLNFESLMGVAGAKPSQVEDAHRTLIDCLDRANSVLVPLKRANEQLQAALDEVGSALASVTAPKPN